MFLFKVTTFEKILPTRGIEPGPRRWKAGILTIRPTIIAERTKWINMYHAMASISVMHMHSVSYVQYF